MIRFVLIRPGSTDFDEQGRIQGTLDIPLSARGSADVPRVAEELKNQGLKALYSAPCQSAWQTATAIGKVLGVKPKQIDKLHNVDQGLWQGMLIDDVKHKQPKVYRQWQEHPENVCPPEGEMLGQVEERIQAVFTKLFKKHRDSTVGLVLPEPLATIVHSCLAKTEVGDLWKGCSACGTWEVVAFEVHIFSHRGLTVKSDHETDSNGVVSIELNH
jgi:probable phosphoglycerate mutase